MHHPDGPPSARGEGAGPGFDFPQLFAAHPLPMWVYDVETLGFLAVNDAAIAQYGYEREAMLQLTLLDLRPSSEVERLLENVKRTSEGLDRAGVWRHQRRDGTPLDVEITTHSLVFGGRRAKLVVAKDVTAVLHAQRSLTRMERLHAMLSHTSQLLVRRPERAALYADLCRIATEHGGFALAWIGLVQPDGTIRPTARSGTDDGYVDGIRATTDPASPRGHGPAARAVREGAPAVANDFLAVPEHEPWYEAATLASFRAVAALPFREAGAVVGTLVLYAREVDFFDHEVLATLGEMADNLSYGLDVLAREAERASLERALTLAEERWRYALEGAGHGVWEWRAETNEIFFSAEWKRMLGYDEHEISPSLLEWQSRVHPADLDATYAAITKHLINEDDAYALEYRLRCKDGSYKWILDRGRVIRRTASGAPSLVVGTHTDVTTRRLAEEALRESEARLREAVEVAHLGSWSVDLETERVSWSEGASRVHGLDLREIGTLAAFSQRIHPEDKAILAGWMRAGRAGLSPGQVEYRALGPDGAVKHLRGTVAVRTDATGKPTRLAGAVQDVTAEREAARMARETAERLALALEAGRQGIYDLDLRTGRAEVNATYAALLGHDPATFEETNAAWLERLHPDDRESTLQVFRDYVAGRIPSYRVEFRQRRRQGDYVWLLSVGRVVERAPDGTPLRMLGTHTDIHEWRVAEQALRDSEARFRALTEQSLVGIYTLADGRIAYMNPRGAAIFGYSPAELAGAAFGQLVQEDERALVQARFDELAEAGAQRLEHEFRGRRKDGALVLIGTHGTVAQVERRSVVIGALQDITDRRHAEETIRDYVKRLESAVLGTAAAVAQMVELRDPYTAGHERRVGEIAAAIAGEMGLSLDVQRGLRVAGAVHDVGKIMVPAEILSKPARLSAVEFELVKQHAVHGYEVLKGVPFPWPVAEVAHQHHERMDGSGYPQGLVGAAILLEARILAVADVLESMASHRPYRPGLGLPAALGEIEQNAGRLYDPEAAAACLRLFREKGYALPV